MFYRIVSFPDWYTVLKSFRTFFIDITSDAPSLVPVIFCLLGSTINQDYNVYVVWKGGIDSIQFLIDTTSGAPSLVPVIFCLLGSTLNQTFNVYVCVEERNCLFLMIFQERLACQQKSYQP